MSNKCKDLSNLSIVNLDFDLWSGQAKLKDDDLIIGNGGEIPPKELASLGRKRLIDPKMLNPFHALKTRAETICLTHGMKFLNSSIYAIPKDRIGLVDEGLKKIEPEMKMLVDDFLSKYQKGVDEWASANPNYAQAIRLAAPSDSSIRSRFGFEYDIINVSSSADTNDATDKLSKRVEKLDSDLMEEVANDATNFFTKNLSGRDGCSVRTRQTLKRIRDKVDGLSFLNSAFLPLVNLLDETITGYDVHRDKKGLIQGSFFYQVIAVTLIMSDPEKIKAYANGSVDPSLMASEMMPGSEYIQPTPHQPEQPQSVAAPVQASAETEQLTATLETEASHEAETEQVVPPAAEIAAPEEVISDSTESVNKEPSLEVDPFDFDGLVDAIMPQEDVEVTAEEVEETTEKEVIEVANTADVTESSVLFPAMESMPAPDFAVNGAVHTIVPLQDDVDMAEKLIPAVQSSNSSEVEEAFF